MQILNVLSNYLLLGLGVLLFLFVWGSSLAAMAASTARRGLPRADRLFWLALGIVLPLVGFGLYGLARLAARVMAGGPQPEAAGSRDSTGIRSQEAPAPVGMPPPAPPYSPRPSDTIPAPVGVWPAPAACPGACRLMLVEGPSAGLQYVLENLPLRIGRGAEVHIRISGDLRISRVHAEFYQAESGLRVRDLGSTHGTLVNGVLLSDAPLQPGDQIRMGDTLMRVECS